jgi:hypothetical protein
MTLARTRVVRLSALALATGTLVATASTGAFAAGSSSGPTSFEGSTTSNAISLSLLKGAPGLSSVPGIDTSQGLVSAQLLNGTSTLVHDGTGSKPDSADSTITLLGGTLASLAAAGGSSNPIPTASSSLKSPGPNSAAGPFGAPAMNTLGPLGTITAPDFTATSTKSPLTTGTSAAGLDLSTLKLSDVVPASDLAQFTTGYKTLISQVSTLQSAIAALAAAGSALPVPAGTDPIGDLSAALTTIQTEAQNAYDQITGGSLATAENLVSDSSIKTVGSQEVSTAHVALGSLSLLGGFASVTGFNNTVTAKAGGTPGTASFTPDMTHGGEGALTVAGVGGSLDGSGLSITGLDSALSGVLGSSDTFTAQLNNAFTALQSGLTMLNQGLMGLVTLTADTPSDVNVAKDGTSASGRLDGLGLAINLPDFSGLPSLPTLPALPAPLSGIPGLATIISTLSGLGLPGVGSLSARAAAAPTTTQVLGLSVGSASATAGALVQSPAVAGESNATTPTGVLAFTGADLPLTAGIATLLIAGSVGLVIRRRRIHEEI